MKKIIFLFSFLCLNVFAFSQAHFNSVLAGTSTGTAVASSCLEGRSTTKGFLPPRMTTTQRNAIAAPATALMVYNTSTGFYNYYNAGWQTLATGTSTTFTNGLSNNGTQARLGGTNLFTNTTIGGLGTKAFILVDDTTSPNLLFGFGNLNSLGEADSMCYIAADSIIFQGQYFLQFASLNPINIGNYTIPVNDGSSGQVLTTNGSGVVSFQNAPSSGIYKPQPIDSSNAVMQTDSAQYSRTGNTVTVSGQISIDPTLAATTTYVTVTLPVSTNLTSAFMCSGTAFCGAIAAQGAQVTGDITLDAAKIVFKSADITNQTWSYIFEYTVR